MTEKMPETYQERLQLVTDELQEKFGSFNAAEVHLAMKERGWAGPLDSVIDTHKELVKMFGEPKS